MAPKENDQPLQKWASDRGLEVGQFSGPPFSPDEISRTKRKIETEQKQLPRDCPNMVAIRSCGLFANMRDIEATIADLKGGIRQYPHLLGIVIRGQRMGKCEDTVVTRNGFILVQRNYADLLVEHYMVILNTCCAFRIPPTTLSKLCTAFTMYV